MIKNFSLLDDSQIQECLNNKSVKIGIIGIGRIGLPTALSFANSGFDTIGIDINKKLVDMVNSGNYPLTDEPEFDKTRVKNSHDGRMKMIMTLKDCTTIADIESFLEGSQKFAYTVLSFDNSIQRK